jgi:hypothetical protein
MKYETLDQIFEISLIALAVAITTLCSYTLTAGLLDRPPNLDAVPFNESSQCESSQCEVEANIPNDCPDDTLNC